MIRIRLTIYFGFLCLFISCSSRNNSGESVETNNQSIKYAVGFTIDYSDNYKKITIRQPYKGASTNLIYYLFEKDGPNIPNDGIKIKIPVTSIVCSSTTHLPALAMLNVEDALVGFPSVNYISTPAITQRIESGKVRELGAENGMDMEGIVELSPNLMMGYLMTGDSKQYDKLIKAGIPVVINSDYLEENPLGRAEWIKFIAAFFNKEAEADSIFENIVNEYNQIKIIANSSVNKPKVFSGIVYGGTWFMPAGDSWAGIYFNDAVSQFPWSDVHENGSLELSFESVLEKAKDADYWIGASNFESLDALALSDERYKLFTAFQTGNVYTYTKRVNNSGGNDFFETGFAHPDWVLSDMVKILHPELLPDKPFYFFQKLE